LAEKQKREGKLFIQAYLPSIESAILIWITKAVLPHQVCSSNTSSTLEIMVI